MCGIVGAVSKNRNILPILITGLKNLEYRGYDSAGVAYLKNNKINIVKTSGKVSELENKLNKSDESNDIGWFSRHDLEEMSVFPDVKISFDYILRNYFGGIDA